MEWHNEDCVDGSALPLPEDNVDVSGLPVCAMADNFRHHWMTNKEVFQRNNSQYSACRQSVSVELIREGIVFPHV